MIVVTGAAGFIGSRLVERFQGQELLSVDFENPTSRGPQHRGIDFGKWLLPHDFLSQWREGTVRPSVVFHMGACSSTTETRWDYLQEVNIKYSESVWELATRDNTPLLYASSAATYGAGELGYSDDPALLKSLRPLNLYGRSKAEFDLWALNEAQKGRSPSHWGGFKFFNVYGFGERHKGPQSSVVSKAYDEIRETGRLKLFKSARSDIRDGHQARDFVWVGDVCEAMTLFWKHEIKSGLYNLGSGRARTFLDLAHATFRALDQHPEIEWIETPKNIAEGYQYFTEANLSRLTQAFRQKGVSLPTTTLEQGVTLTIQALKQEGQ